MSSTAGLCISGTRRRRFFFLFSFPFFSLLLTATREKTKWANGGHYEGTKAGTRVKSTVKISIIAENPKFVCRGGLKLEKALEEFDVDVEGKVALDSGLSTGGFTDCLLQCGVVKVYGVDVGYGQVAEKVRVDPRVVVMVRVGRSSTHARREHLPSLKPRPPTFTLPNNLFFR